MKVSVQWLNELVRIGPDPELIASVLTQRGLQCESIQPYLDDWVLDLEVTSNRGDCLGLIGIARELAAASGLPLMLPQPNPIESQTDVSELVSVELQEPKLCRRYTARVIEDLTVGPSPEWMVRRLEAVGIRSVCNVVDATNYAMIETGQPPHAFDLAKISQGRIIVRRATAGEKLLTIDGTECRLEPQMLVIADPTGPVAIAGVMGGKSTEVTPATRSILLEDAFFDPVTVRTTARALGLSSEAALRFGHIVDIEQIAWASLRTAELIQQVAGGRMARGLVDIYPERPRPLRVSLRPQRLRHVLGTDVPEDKVRGILTGLGFRPQPQPDRISCTIPSWRPDVSREIDLIEEVARCYGYEKLPTKGILQIKAVAADPLQGILEQIGHHLNACGFYEAINVDLIDKGLSDLFVSDQDDQVLMVRDPKGRSNTVLRRTLLGSLALALRTNIFAKNLPCRLYEIATTFTPQAKAALPKETLVLGLIADQDLRLIRAGLEGAIMKVLPKARIELVPTHKPWAYVAADVLVNGQVIGVAGVMSDKVKDALDIKNIWPVCGQIDLDSLLAMPRTSPNLEPLPRFPAIVRDISIFVDLTVPWAQINKVVQANAPQELEHVRFVDLYLGKGVPQGKKAVTLSLSFRDKDGTLQHQQVDLFQQTIVDALATQLGAQLRGPNP